MSSLQEFLSVIKMDRYLQKLKGYGVETFEDILILTPDDWQHIGVLPFHRNKIIHGAAHQIEIDNDKMKKEIIQSNDSVLINYKITYSGVYTGAENPQVLKKMDATLFATASANPSWMNFAFCKPATVYGVILGVDTSWGGSYLENLQIQVKKNGQNAHSTVFTVTGVPNVAKSGYLACINQQNVLEVRLNRTAYFSLCYIRFV